MIFLVPGSKLGGSPKGASTDQVWENTEAIGCLNFPVLLRFYSPRKPS